MLYICHWQQTSKFQNGMPEQDLACLLVHHWGTHGQMHGSLTSPLVWSLVSCNFWQFLQDDPVQQNQSLATISMAMSCRFWLQSKVHQVRTTKSHEKAIGASSATCSRHLNGKWWWIQWWYWCHWYSCKCGRWPAVQASGNTSRGGDVPLLNSQTEALSPTNFSSRGRLWKISQWMHENID